VKAKAMQHIEELVKKAAILSRTAHPQWQEFLTALSVYTNKQVEILVKSPVADLQVAQGKTQALTALVEHLSNAVATSDKIAERAKK
jgi:hypothetical protein